MNKNKWEIVERLVKNEIIWNNNNTETNKTEILQEILDYVQEQIRLGSKYWVKYEGKSRNSRYYWL